MRTPIPQLFPALLAACVTDSRLGPDLGTCADYPDHAYTFGQAGVGRCLAGPAALQFHAVDGRTLLAVSNADPFRTYSSGSLLELDADALADARGVVLADALPAWSLPMEPFVGGFAIARGGTLALVSSRLSSGSYLRRVKDRVWFVDLTDPERPAFLEDQRYVAVGADPFATVLDAAQERVYVVNATDVSISVLDVSVVPPQVLDTAPRSIVTDPVLEPVPGSIVNAELLGEPLPDLDVAETDAWTATYVEGTFRLWAPTPIDSATPDGATGLARWTSGDGDYTPSALGLELDPEAAAILDDIRDPWFAVAGNAGVLYHSDGEAVYAANTAGFVGTWVYTDALPALTGGDGWNDLVSGPSVVEVLGQPRMYFDGRPAPGEPARVGVAISADGLRFDAEPAPAVEPPPGFTTIEQPSVLVDPFTGTVRMWASVRGADGWAIVEVRSSDAGLTWGTPQVVLAPPGGQAAAPVVFWFGGRYRMWLTVAQGDTWAHATSWSWDGLDWAEPEVVVPSEVPVTVPPPRVVVQPAPALRWRVTGADAGAVQQPLIPEVPLITRSQGFALRVASGQLVGTGLVPDADGGLIPGSLAQVDGLDTLYVTVVDEDGRARLAALRRVADRWLLAADDLVPVGVGGNDDGVSDPVVYPAGGRWQLLYTATSGEVSVLRRAVSDDGLRFRPEGGPVLPQPQDFEAVRQTPHSIVEEDGTFTMYYAGFDGSRWRIASARSDDGLSFSARALELDVGEPGSFDDSGVRDPMVVRDGDALVMWYTADDGDTLRLGFARRDDGDWVRRTTPLAAVPSAVLGPIERSFAADGVRAPVATPDGDGFELLFGGLASGTWRVGDAKATQGEVFPRLRFPAAGDRFTFSTLRGQPGRAAIDLAQIVQGVALPGVPGTTFTEGPAAAILDPDAGMLWVGSEDFPGLIAVDVRDDSTPTFTDLNFLDIEAVVRFDTTTRLLGVSALARAPSGLLYLSTKEPDAVLAFDPSVVVDDAVEQVLDHPTIGVLPMHDLTDDDGEQTFAALGAAGLAVVPDQNLLIVTGFRDNTISFFDLTLGAWGTEIRHLEDVGENPHAVAIAPDQTWAVVATYLGETPTGAAGGSLLVLDLDPESPTYLDIRARVVNQ